MQGKNSAEKLLAASLSKLNKDNSTVERSNMTYGGASEASSIRSRSSTEKMMNEKSMAAVQRILERQQRAEAQKSTTHKANLQGDYSAIALLNAKASMSVSKR